MPLANELAELLEVVRDSSFGASIELAVHDIQGSNALVRSGLPVVAGWTDWTTGDILVRVSQHGGVGFGPANPAGDHGGWRGGR